MAGSVEDMSAAMNTVGAAKGDAIYRWSPRFNLKCQGRQINHIFQNWGRQMLVMKGRINEG
jgi:hypothetical protein